MTHQGERPNLLSSDGSIGGTATNPPDGLDRLQRKEAANRKLETMRFHYIFWPTLLAALAAVWFVVRDLMK
jgi:hypothetical protein